jgi:transcription elongation factor GreA
MNGMPISAKGFQELQRQLRHLKEVERPAALEAVQRARELGDLSENADYKAGKEHQKQLDFKIKRLESIADNANIIDTGTLSGDTVMFGAIVMLEDEDGKKAEYRILSEFESDLSKNIISNTSPLARVLIGKSIGMSFSLKMPAGEKEYTVIDMKYGD